MELLPFGFLRVSGKDTQQFLQGQLTCDITKVSYTTILRGAYCNAKGRVVANFLAISASTAPNEQSAIILITPNQPILKHLIATLKKYAIFSKVTIEPIDYFAAGFLQKPPVLTQNTRAQYREMIYESSQHRQLAISPDITTLTENIAPKTLITSTGWQQYDIALKLANIAPEISEKYTPHQLGYEKLGLINFKKGCYIGQEIIARMHYLGKTKKTVQAIKHTPNTDTSKVISRVPQAPIANLPDTLLLT